MSTSELLLQLLIGGLLGLVGQTLRFIIGYKKLHDLASKEKVSPGELFQTSSMLTSLLIGFAAGVLAITSISTWKSDFFSTNTRETLMTLVAAGYAGTDFIEGLIKKHIPNPNLPSNINKDTPADDLNMPGPQLGAVKQPII
jgi:putative chitinase